MGTRGCIARSDNNGGFIGVYHHWDSYPSGLGKTLFNLYNNVFDKNLTNMLEYLIDNHPAGWSTINDSDFSKTPGFGREGPNCYCHGDRSEQEWIVTEKNASGSGCEYAYVFDVDNVKMLILSSYTEKYGKMIGAFGCGDPHATWKLIAIVNLNGKEPNWSKLDD